MKIAVVGCSHGRLDNIYDTIEYIEKQNNINIELILCCGDFQATRNLEDLKCMAAPPKYRVLCTFYKYYSGAKLAPKLTIFIGGNHEASNYLQELPYGGWVAPNIYYLGHAGVVNFAGIRIAGLSGIYKGWDFPKGKFEKPPYNEETLRSCFHIRNLDVFRLKQLSSPVHIMMSHDWPTGIVNHGNVEQLLKKKPFFREDIESNSLGSKPAAELLEYLRPEYWFAAHLHVKFAALVKHNTLEPKQTKFLALDKCLPGRKFLQVLDIPHDADSDMELKYDLEWLGILHLTNHLLSVKKLNTYMPGPGSSERYNFTPTKEEKDMAVQKFQSLVIPRNFVPTAPAHNSSTMSQNECVAPINVNSQTVEFCSKLGIDDPIGLILNEDGFSNTSYNLNMSNLEFSSFIGGDSEEDISLSNNSGLFKKRTSLRTPLKLPTPNVELPENDVTIFTSTPTAKREMTAAAIDEPNTSNAALENDTSNLTDSASQTKKFKRRNIAIYSNEDDD